MSKELVEWIAWADKKPYMRCYRRRLTTTQKSKYQQLQRDIGLQAAADYAVKVGDIVT